MKQVTLEELERITGLPRYAVVVAVGLTAKKYRKKYYLILLPMRFLWKEPFKT